VLSIISSVIRPFSATSTVAPALRLEQILCPCLLCYRKQLVAFSCTLRRDKLDESESGPSSGSTPNLLRSSGSRPSFAWCKRGPRQLQLQLQLQEQGNSKRCHPPLGTPFRSKNVGRKIVSESKALKFFAPRFRQTLLVPSVHTGEKRGNVCSLIRQKLVRSRTKSWQASFAAQRTLP